MADANMNSTLMPDYYRFICPVIGVVEAPKPQTLQITDVLGTAFSIGQQRFLTAAHVSREALTHARTGIGHAASSKVWVTHPIQDVEIIDDFDIAIFSSDAPDFEALPWMQDDLPLLSEVQASGFPYSLNPRMGSLNARAFRGTIAGTDRFERLPTYLQIYELSF